MKYRAHRHPTRFPITLEAEGLRQRTTLSNISASGASIETDARLSVGAQVVLDHFGGQLRATVCWSNEEMLGLSFTRPLSLAEVERFRYQSHSGGQSVAGHRRPQTIGFKMLG